MKSKENIWKQKINPFIVDIPSKEYSKYIPQVDIFPIPVFDEFVIERDKELSQSIEIAREYLGLEIGFTISLGSIIHQIPEILAGRNEYLLLSWPNNQKIKVTDSIMRYLSQIQNAIMERLLLFEDMSGLNFMVNNDYWDAENHYENNVKHSFLKRNKVKKIMQLISNFPHQKVVIFVRNISICEGLTSLIKEEGFNASYIHSKVESEEENLILDKFRDANSDTNILILSRQKYGRGFDLPQADIAMFYSPKSNVRSIWQEVLRIRGTTENPKSVYILYYSWTAEFSKFTKLIDGMLDYGAVFHDFYFKWAYIEAENETKSETSFEGMSVNASRISVIKKFVQGFLKSLDHYNCLSRDDKLRYIYNIADSSKLLNFWADGFIHSFIFDLVELSENWDNSRINDQTYIVSSILKYVHPDLHLDSKELEVKFWTMITTELIDFLN